MSIRHLKADLCLSHLLINLWFHHISLVEMALFTLSTYCNGFVIYLGMYVALPWQKIPSDIDFVPAAAVYLTHH